MTHNPQHPQALFGDCSIPEPAYTETQTKSFYLPMRDGVRIAIDLVIPAPLAVADRIPALLTQTRYWRSTELRAPFKWLLGMRPLIPRERNVRHFFPERGYALLAVDVRGTGASFGTLTHPWSPDTLEDAREMIDWVIVQPWSNGCVGGFGTSYPGTAAEMLAVLNHPAVRVVIPRFNHPDAYQDIAYPGGLYNQRFIDTWSRFDTILDQNKVPVELGLKARLFSRGVKPVDEDRGHKLLKAAVREHRSNGVVHKITGSVTFCDEIDPSSGISMRAITMQRYQDLLLTTPTAIYGWASWLDAGTGDAAIRRFLTQKNANWAVIGAWDHGGNQRANPFQPGGPVSPPVPVQLAEMLQIFDAYLKNSGSQQPAQKTLHYYTMGEEVWKSTNVWPPAQVTMQPLYFSEGAALSPAQPEQPDGADTYTVDYSVSSGLSNRWWELGVMVHKTVEYPDRAGLAGRVLSYTTAPLQHDLEITGHPLVSLHAASSEVDAAFYVYLEDVSPEGRVTYITEGLLRALHRALDEQPLPGSMPIPARSYACSAAQALVPGEPVCIEIAMFATSVLVRQGHSIRVTIAGHDEGTFRRVPAEGTPVITVYRTAARPSGISLPVIVRN